MDPILADSLSSVKYSIKTSKISGQLSNQSISAITEIELATVVIPAL